MGLSVVAICGYWLWPSSPPIEVLVRDARLAMAASDYEQVEELCQRILSRESDNASALLMAGEALTKLGKLESALDFYLAVPETDPKEFKKALFYAAEVARGLGRFDQAEELYRRLVQQDPNHLDAYERLAFLLDLEGRRWESLPFLLELIRHDRLSYTLLQRLGSRDSAVNMPEQVQQFLEASPESGRATLALAVSEKQPQRKQELFAEAIRRDPQLIEAYARLGRWFSDQNLERIPNWQRNLPPEADSHPEIWTVRGLWAQSVGQKQAA
ncbi:MAG: tetratricopeptide repeat protein, partial [Planctomycetaceae bacterium]|nr:tetratricopeptide repeat protein [Planctomycetaceae bacterium]